MMLEMCLEEEPADSTRERLAIISQNSRTLLETKPKKKKHINNHKRGYEWGINKGPEPGNMPDCRRHF
jgi:hypothetical protein